MPSEFNDLHNSLSYRRFELDGKLNIKATFFNHLIFRDAASFETVYTSSLGDSTKYIENKRFVQLAKS